MIKPKGRPATQCSHCRESRKSKQLHTKCMCGSGSSGKQHSATCPCHFDKDLCTCSKNKQTRRTVSNPPPHSRIHISTPNPAAVTTPSPSPASVTSVARSSSSSSLASNSSRSRQRKSTIMNSRGAIIHPSSSASLSTKLSLMNNNAHLNDLNDSGDDTKSPSSLPMLFPFTGAAEDVAKNGDLLKSLDSPSYHRNQAFFPSSSQTSLSTMMQDQQSFGSVSSLNFITGSSNQDGYASDAEPPLQLNYARYNPPPSRRPVKVDTDLVNLSSGPVSASHRVGEIVLNPDDSVLDDFTLLSPDDNFELLANGQSALGLLERVDNGSDYSDDPSQYFSPKTSARMASPSSAANISADSSEVNLFQNHQQDQVTIKHQQQRTSSAASNHPLYPILTANRPPHKDVDYASYLAQSRANAMGNNTNTVGSVRRSSPSSTQSSGSPSSFSVPKNSDTSVSEQEGRSPLASTPQVSLYASGSDNFEKLQDPSSLQIKDIYPSPFDEMPTDTSSTPNEALSRATKDAQRQSSAQAEVQREFPLTSEFSPLFMHDDFYGFDSDFNNGAAQIFGLGSNESGHFNGGDKLMTSPKDSGLFGTNHAMG